MAKDATGEEGDDPDPTGGGDARVFVFDLEETTSIESKPTTLPDTSDKIFNLAGLQVDAALLKNNGLKPGLYIINGKKVLRY